MKDKIARNNLFAFSIKISNILDHFDAAFYVFIIPVIGPFFFKDINNSSLFLLSGGIFFRPLGALIFSHLSLKYNISKLLCISLSGVALSTFAMGLVPISYNYYGLILLLILRFIQGFFTAAESSLSSLYLLNITPEFKHGSASGYYISSTMIGYLLASFAASIVISSTSPEIYWRIPFLIGLLPTICALVLRITNLSNLVDNSNSNNFLPSIKSSFLALYCNRINLIKVMIISGFDVTTYYFVFSFCLKFIPMVSNVTTIELYSWNNILLIFDALTAIVVGKILNKFSAKAWLISTSIIFTCFVVIALKLLINADSIVIIVLRFILVTVAVAYSVGVKPFLIKLVDGPTQYLIINTGSYLGSEIFGRLTPGICMLLYSYTNNSFAPSFYIVFILILALISLSRISECL